MKQDRLFPMKYLVIYPIQINTVTSSSMAHSVFTSMSRIYKKASAKAQGWCGIQQNFTKVTNMMNPKLNSKTDVIS